MNETLGLQPKPAETTLPATSSDLLGALHAALANVDNVTLETLTSQNPRDLFCWAALTVAAGDGIDGYAFARVGYHRGLDTLRASGWRGSGYVRASVPSNRGFLTCLALLQHQATVIGEQDEQERCLEFLQQLDPSFDWKDFPFGDPGSFLFSDF